MEVLNNQLCTKIFCVLPASSSEITYTEDLISAKNCCQRHKLNVVCILENDCLKLTPSKECVFVLTDFDSPLFEFLLSFECKVVGPQCLLNSLKNGQPIPSTAVFNLAMKGIVVTTTGLTMQEKKEAEKKIQFMGGIYTSNLTSSTTHLIAKSVADFGLKFKSARSRAIPIMLPKWIDGVWSARISQEIVHGNDPEYSSYVCPVFQGFFVCASRISIKERKSIKKMVEANGGKYCPQLIEGETNVLITTSCEGEKYLYARSWKIFCLKPEWVQNSLDLGYVCDPERFTVKKITKLPPKCSSSEENKLPVADFNYASINSTIFNNSTKELDETSTNGSTSPLNQQCELQSTEPLECLDLVLSLKAGRFLKGFKIFPSGFDGPQMEKLRRVLKNAGAIQLNAINDESISHVIVGKSVKKDWKQLQHLDIKPHVVTLQWLTRSLQLKAPAPEAEYYPTDFENLSTPNRKKSFFQDTSSELPSVTTNVSLDDVRTTVQYSTLSQKTYHKARMPPSTKGKKPPSTEAAPKPFKCDICSFATKSKGNLKTHHTSKHTERDSGFECKQCAKICKTKFDLDQHQQNDCNEMEGQCSKCKTVFTTKGTLTRHIRDNKENPNCGQETKKCQHAKKEKKTPVSIGLDVRPENGEQIDEVNVDVNIVTHGEMEVEDQDQFKAVERLKLFEAKYSSLNEERDKVGKAKEALEPQETGPISTNEERMQVTYRELEIFTPPRGRLFSKYTSSPTEAYQDFSDDHDDAVFNADCACYSMLFAFDLSPISRQIYNKTAPVNTTVQSTESNLDRRDQLIWDDEIFSMVGQVSEKEEELMRVKLELSKHQQQVVELEKKCRSLQQANDKLSNSLSQKKRELEERNQSHHHMTVKIIQLEETVTRLEQKNTELLATTEKGEGFIDAAIQQIQQDNVNKIIAEVIRFSQGFKTAEKLAQKIVQFFKLICDEQLPNQSHYDFGLRSLISVLVSAGKKKRDRIQKIKKDMQARGETIIDESVISENLPEQDILIQSVCETMVPNLVAAHIPFLFALLNDVFPGITYTRAEMARLRKQIRNVCREEFFVCKENDGQEGRTKDSMWMKKVLELYESSQVKHGLMLVGPSGSGKSSALLILFKSLERLEGTEGVAHVIDRKATTKEALFGVLDPDTHQWTDGPFTRILRNIINNVREEINKRHWIIFHGDVDPELVENLDSVLDSNKLLTLPNGERISIPPNVRIMVEVQDLKYATLATKSRWGRVWFSEDDLTPQMLLKHYLARLRHVPLEEVKEDTVRTPSVTNIQFQKEVAGILKPYFSPDGLVVRALEHAATRLEHINFTRFWALNDLFTMLDQSVRTILNYNCTHQDFPLDPDGHDPFYSKALVYAILCSFAGDGNLKARKNLSEFLQGLTPIKLPSPTMLIMDYKVKIGEERISVFKSASDGSGNS